TLLKHAFLEESDGGVLIVPMVERLDEGLAARLALHLDANPPVPGSGVGVIALDESDEGEEPPPEALSERLALHLDLRNVAYTDVIEMDEEFSALHAQAALGGVAPLSDEQLAVLSELAATLDAPGLGAVVLAMRAVIASAAVFGRRAPAEEDLLAAVRLVIAPRARRAPPSADEAQEPPETPPEPENTEGDKGDADEDAADRLLELAVESARAAVPPGLMEEAGVNRRAGAGARRRGRGGGDLKLRRGRPAGVRTGSPARGGRLDIVATLSAAAPWRNIRSSPGGGGNLQVRPDDFRIRRFKQPQELTIVFCVDASGSTAVNRLAEAKGAVELLLADAYVTRTYAGLIAFRGEAAEVLLEPTRALARAKAQLADLPGGGATPLASGLEAAYAMGLRERRRGRDVLIVLLTDGRGNMSRAGVAGRDVAAEETKQIATAIARDGFDSVVIDTSPRRRPEGPTLAEALRARYAPLPFLDAASLQSAVRAAAPKR
ncbi:MAG: VWA domain-containing protein, partial [Pseudomonadota bacterium]